MTAVQVSYSRWATARHQLKLLASVGMCVTCRMGWGEQQAVEPSSILRHASVTAHRSLSAEEFLRRQTATTGSTTTRNPTSHRYATKSQFAKCSMPGIPDGIPSISQYRSYDPSSSCRSAGQGACPGTNEARVNAYQQ